MKNLYLYYDVVAHARVPVSDEEYEKFEAMTDNEKDRYVNSHFSEEQVDILEYEFSSGIPFCIENSDGDELYEY